MYIDYVPAQVCVGKIPRIVYYAKNPLTERQERVVVKCNRVRHKAERMRYARSIADNINEKLRRGWNLFVDRMSTEGYTLLVDAVEQFVHEKERELRKDSIRSFRSLAKPFVDWLEQQGYGQSYACMFNEVFARKYMESLAADDSIGARTYNSYLRFQRTLFFWMVERRYAAKSYSSTLAAMQLDYILKYAEKFGWLRRRICILS